MSAIPKGIDPKVWEMAIALADIWQAPMHHDYQVFAEDVAGAILKAKNDAYEEAATYGDAVVKWVEKELAENAEDGPFVVKAASATAFRISQAIRNLKHKTEV